MGMWQRAQEPTVRTTNEWQKLEMEQQNKASASDYVSQRVE